MTFSMSSDRSPTPISVTVCCSSWQMVITTCDLRTIWPSAHTKIFLSRPDLLYLKLLSCCGRLECMS